MVRDRQHSVVLHPTVQRLSLPGENRPARGALSPGEINRWIARWENEGGAVALGPSANHVTE
jgi:hypothetical protein